MIGYIRLKKDNGKTCWIRVDEIAAFSENETKVEGSKELVPCITVLLRNNVAWHFPHVTGEELLGFMRSASTVQLNVTPGDGQP